MRLGGGSSSGMTELLRIRNKSVMPHIVVYGAGGFFTVYMEKSNAGAGSGCTGGSRFAVSYSAYTSSAALTASTGFSMTHPLAIRVGGLVGWALGNLRGSVLKVGTVRTYAW